MQAEIKAAIKKATSILMAFNCILGQIFEVC
ncbi:hypothetical protein PSAR109036_07520 [Psychrobacter arenosus]